jgi:hypothetical protein
VAKKPILDASLPNKQRAFMEMRPTSAYASEAIRLFWKLVRKNFDLVNLRRLIKQITGLSFLH